MRQEKKKEKKKFPDPETLANEVSHILNKKNNSALVAMGSTKGYIDDVRYVSNYSSGSLGTHIAHELYRRGFETLVSCGSCLVKPQNYTSLTNCDTNDSMLESNQSYAKKADAAVFVASVLDYAPSKKVSGKIRSTNDSMDVSMIPTKKSLSTPRLRATSKLDLSLKQI